MNNKISYLKETTLKLVYEQHVSKTKSFTIYEKKIELISFASKIMYDVSTFDENPTCNLLTRANFIEHSKNLRETEIKILDKILRN